MRVTLQGLASPSTAPRLSSSSASSEPPALSPVVEFDGSFDDVSDHMDHKEQDARTHHQQDIPVGWEAQLDIDPIQHLFSPSFASDFTSWLAVAHAVDNCNPSGSNQSPCLIPKSCWRISMLRCNHCTKAAEYLCLRN